MPLNPLILRYPTERQIKIWVLTRKYLSGKEIAEKEGITRPAVSQNLRVANQRIKDLLENTARSNKICIELLSKKYGYVRGYSAMFKVRAYITYSPENGLQVWYDHKGHCENCEEFGDCRRIILQEFKERQITVPNEALRPTELGEILFEKIEDAIRKDKGRK
ncbi:MAG: hypothetical protein ACFFCZ_03370 [Promethearchaeota archaeon]